MPDDKVVDAEPDEPDEPGGPEQPTGADELTGADEPGAAGGDSSVPDEKPYSAGGDQQPSPHPDDGSAPRFTPTVPSGMSRLGRALTKRPTVWHYVVAGLLAVFGFLGALQLRGEEADVLESARRDELGRILVDLTQQGDRLENNVRELERTRQELLNSADSEKTAQQAAEERLKKLKILTGEVSANGPGVIITITGPIKPSTMLSVAAELRAAGAEAIEIQGSDGAKARVVVDTFFLSSDDDDAVDVSGKMLRPPYTILAIGDSSTLSSTVDFPQGIRAEVAQDGAEVIVTDSDNVTIDTLHEPGESEHAHPVPENDD